MRIVVTLLWKRSNDDHCFIFSPLSLVTHCPPFNNTIYCTTMDPMCADGDAETMRGSTTRQSGSNIDQLLADDVYLKEQGDTSTKRASTRRQSSSSIEQLLADAYLKEAESSLSNNDKKKKLLEVKPERHAIINAKKDSKKKHNDTEAKHHQESLRNKDTKEKLHDDDEVTEHGKEKMRSTSITASIVAAAAAPELNRGRAGVISEPGAFVVGGRDGDADDTYTITQTDDWSAAVPSRQQQDETTAATTLVSAQLVTDEEDQANKQVVAAAAVMDDSASKRRMRYFTLAAIVLVAISVAVVVSIGLMRDRNSASNDKVNAVPSPTLSPQLAPTLPENTNATVGETPIITNVTAFGQVWDIATTLIFLEDNGLTGTIPTEVGLLTNLFNFHLRINSLTGPLPSEIGQLQKLNFMNVGGNPGLTGTLPTELGLLTSLKWLGLWDSSYVGTIPTVLGQLTALDVLSLRSNQLSGTIPSELGQLTVAKFLSLFDNFALEGTVPTELQGLALLEQLCLWNTAISGTIAPSICSVETATVFVDTVDPSCSCCEAPTNETVC